MAEKSFFRIKVRETCPYPAVMVKNLGRVTKTWRIMKGLASDYSGYPNLDVQPMVKEGGDFVPVPDADSGAGEELSGAGDCPSNGVAPESQSDETAAGNFPGMTVEQLKAYLSAKGVSSGELRGMAKADLVARAESETA